MLSGLLRTPPPGTARWILGLVAGALMGLAAATSIPWMVAGAASVAALYAFARSKNRAALTVGLYWLSFGAYYTAFAGVQISGFFYPFYLAFFVTILVKAVRNGVRAPTPAVWSYLALMLLVMLSLLQFRGAVGFQVVNRLLVYAFGAMIPLQFSDRRALRVVAVWGTLAGLVVAVWTIVSAARAASATAPTSNSTRTPWPSSWGSAASWPAPTSRTGSGGAARRRASSAWRCCSA